MCNLVGLVLNIKGLSSAGEASFYPSLGCSFFRKESKYVHKVTAMSFFKSSCLFFYNILYVNQFHIQTDSFQEYRGNKTEQFRWLYSKKIPIRSRQSYLQSNNTFSVNTVLK